MTTRDIIGKLTTELDAGITSEVQVVYLLAGIRKLMERDEVIPFLGTWAISYEKPIIRSQPLCLIREEEKSR